MDLLEIDTTAYADGWNEGYKTRKQQEQNNYITMSAAKFCEWINEDSKNKSEGFIPRSTDEVIEFIDLKMKESGMTKRDLAKMVGITEASMSRYMNKKRKMPFDVMIKCAGRFSKEFIFSDKSELNF